MSSVVIGNHILGRLREIGVDTIFGVPGDFNMPLLDLIEDNPKLTFCGNSNELNASYAADGYARIRGAGAIVTTFGVGELSAINGVAGSFSETSPVIHIVGSPRSAHHKETPLLHHTLGDGDFDVFHRMASLVTVASVSLTLDNAISEIDRVIETAFIQKRPGYISIPVDLIKETVQVSSMIHPLQILPARNTQRTQLLVLKQILKLIQSAQRPVIVVDGCVLRHQLQTEAVDFIHHTGFPTFSAPMGKGIVDASFSNYRGIYCGKLSLKGVAEEMEKSDLLIELGSIKSDFNTGSFSYGLENVKTISLHSSCTIIDHAQFPGVGMHELLPLLTAVLPVTKSQLELPSRIKPAPIDDSSVEITHDYFWNKVHQYILPNSVIVSETGTSGFGIFNMESTLGASYIGQILWCSIGYSVGAALGAALADRKRKVYLFVGDGSFQLTAQEISVFIRKGLTPVIFLLNNDGYLTEKMINGPYRDYNNLPMWEYSKSLTYFGGNLEINKSNGKSPSIIGLEVQVNTRSEFEKTMVQVNQEPNKIHFLEVVMPQFDAPQVLSILAADLK
ncbi:hypothetical protein HPULCUR_005010 [Helicostylum pulchrum]|uniref:Pyruvate decarboxylase n=1 Tax=Helicostylum pulchrum TaxID=562976 RepID=A0ABP9XXV8_9FUNG